MFTLYCICNSLLFIKLESVNFFSIFIGNSDGEISEILFINWQLVVFIFMLSTFSDSPASFRVPDKLFVAKSNDSCFPPTPLLSISSALSNTIPSYESISVNVYF